MKSSVLVGGLAALGLVLGLSAQAAEKAAKVLWPAGDIKWTDNAAVKGAQQAVLWGDPKTGPYGALKKVPGGTDLGLHSHTHDQKVVMMSGTISFNFEGEAAKDMPPGSYTFIPGGAKHSAICKAGADCTYFEEGAGASDFKPEAAKK